MSASIAHRIPDCVAHAVRVAGHAAAFAAAFALLHVRRGLRVACDVRCGRVHDAPTDGVCVAFTVANGRVYDSRMNEIGRRVRPRAAFWSTSRPPR